MKLFGKKRKIEFDARKPLPREIAENIATYDFVHNFKVHYKSSGLQLLASKLDLSISSDSPELPTPKQVEEAANARLQGTTLTITKGSTSILGTPLGRFGKKDLAFSYHVTNIEYKESIAMLKGW
jgi:hypothetical protein